MFYQQDWVMKQIELLVRFIARVVFKKDTAEYTRLLEELADGSDTLRQELRVLLASGQLCRAENHLFEMLDTKNRHHLEIALEFYARLNLLSDSELEAADFSREEIKEGLQGITELFGLDFAKDFFNQDA